MDTVGQDPCLGSGEAHRLQSQCLHRQSKEGGADLLPGGQAQIQLPGPGYGVLSQGLFREQVCGMSLGGHHHNHLAALPGCLRRFPGGPGNIFPVRQGRSPKFHHDPHIHPSLWGMICRRERKGAETS